MKILSMTATFGKLERKTLQLHDGLNVRTAPNEWGKSTWCAFLCAMLYGFDLREPAGQDGLADHEKYLPWSGRPMEGILRVIHQGRDITIRRRQKGRTPLGEFMAWDTQSGQAVRELTAENCGLILLGVEKSVFLRTGFLRFSDLPVKADDALRRRLNALVTTGDESGNAELLETKLRELQDRCGSGPEGLISDCQTQLRQTQEQLWERQSLSKQHDAACIRLARREEELDQLENHIQTLNWLDAEADRKRIEDAQADARTAMMLEKALQEKYTDNHDRSEVEAKIRQGESLLEELELSLVEPPANSMAVTVTALLSALLLIVAMLSADRGLLIPCLVMAAVMLAACLLLIGKRRRQRIWYNIEQTRRQGKHTELVNFISSWRSQLRVLDELDRARENVTRTQTHIQDLQAMARTAPEPEFPDELTLSREDTLRVISALNLQLDQDRRQLAQLRGRMEGLPEEEQLQRQLNQLRRRLAELEKTRSAIGYAQQALRDAVQELQQRFAPRITRRAGQFLSRLTNGVYDRIAIDEDLTVLAARDRETGLRSAAWRSEGTADQMYLALRLAVWEVLAPQSPLILDDALIRFDQSRMERAMDLLKELGKTRQILLFSCQEREREYLDR